MKYLPRILVIALLAACAGFSACNLDPCEDGQQGCVHGQCLVGVCDCDPGWEGDSCQDSAFMKFTTRKWAGFDTCADETLSYTIEIVRKSRWEDGRLGLVNFHGVNDVYQSTDTVYATMLHSNAFEVGVRTVRGLNDTIDILGGEALFDPSDSSLIIQFTVDRGNGLENCEAFLGPE